MVTRQPADRETESFEGLLLRHRGRTGLTQRELAERVGVNRRTIQDWENGLNFPSTPRLQSLIAALLASGGLTPGREAAEAEALWAAALRESPRMQTPLDPVWLAEQLSRRVSATGRHATPDQVPSSTLMASTAASERRHDWGDAPDVLGFLGRGKELATLQRAILKEGCRLVAVLGMGGIGKTMLGARVAEEVAPAFERVYWRGMRNAPPLEEWFSGAIGFLSDQQVLPPSGEPARVETLLQLLRERRCLLILDNLETLLEPGRSEGGYRERYAAYGTLLHAVAEGRHQSCLLVTSRETPPELAILGGGPSVCVMELSGLEVPDGQALLADKDLAGDERDWANLVARFGGNGLALKVVGETIRQVFGGRIGAFFDEAGSRTVFGGIKRLLDEQVTRSSALEQYVLARLAIEREPVTVAELLTDLGAHLSRGAALETIEALRHRSLVERTQPGAAFTLQSVVLEYVTDRLVEQVAAEVASRQPDQLVRHPLVKATAKDYLRRTQEHLICEPILQQLTGERDARRVERLLLDLLEDWRTRKPAEQGYGPGNAINLLRLLRDDLRGLDLSDLFIRQAYLQEVEAQDASLANAQIAETVLGGAFDAVNCVAVSADGAQVAAGTLGGDVRVWQVADRMPLVSVHGHSGSVGGVALSADGRIIASGGFDGTVRLWDAQTGRPCVTLQGHAGGVFDVALSGDGQIVASCGNDGTVRLWNAADGRPLSTLRGHSGGVYSVAISADGRTIVSGGLDGTLRLWNAMGQEPPKILEAQPGGVVRVAVSSDGRTIAGCGLDGTVQLWDAEGSRPLAVLRGHTGGVYSVALSADGRIVASCGFDGTVRLWETGTEQLLATLQTRTGAVYGVALSRDGATVASGSLDGTVRLWEVDGGRALATLQGHSNGIWGVAISADGRTLASGSFDGTVRLWTVESGRLVATLRGHSSVYGVALSADGQIVAGGAADGMVRVWTTDGNRLLATLHGHVGGVIDVAVSGDERIGASGGSDGIVRLWESRTHRVVAALQASSGTVYSVALSGDGGLLATGDVEGVVQLWDTANVQLAAKLEGHTGAIYGVSISADARRVASCGFDGTVRLWEAPSGTPLAILHGHTGAVYSVALSADGQMVASCGFDGTVRLWEAPGGRLLATLEGHTGAVRGMAFGAGGRTVASGSLDGTVKLWDTASFSLLRTLRPDRRYARMDITGLTGVTEAQRTALLALGATERHHDASSRVIDTKV
jgi:WD40 repeat protein/transcriptional regulator with XRE-family HTH domain